MLSKEQRDLLETRIIDLILAVRSAYMHECKGRSALDYWTRIENRMQAAARRAKSASHWCTLFLQGMQLTNVDNSGSSAMTELIAFCDETDCHRELRALIKDEHPFLVVQAKLIIQAIKEKKTDQIATKFDAASIVAAAEKYGILEEEKAI